ncbi:MAG TPA: glycoside hydrolase family 16 protein [Ktedonobacteraceae bacterium]|nr:glycoside hydrolase family 16 protein [Ktedonobacteraceae bacterium]
MMAELQHTWLCQQGRGRLRVTAVLIGIVGSIVLNPLTACGSVGSMPATTAKIATTTSFPQTQTESRRLVWSDEFDGASGTPPDSSKWSPRVGGGGWGNKQLDYDTDNQNVYQDGQGNLVIEARKGNPTGLQCWYGACQYTSAQISTKGHFSFTYGLLEARMKIPRGHGLWTAFWLLGNNCDSVGWPTCGEVDIMENIGDEPAIAHATIHGPGYFDGAYHLNSGALADDFHSYAVQWDPQHLYFLIDGKNYYTLDKATLKNQGDWVYDHPFSIILNVAVGGTWPGNPASTTIFPQKLYVSYIRLYTN